ncbi:DUF6508 domain-containing protein [Streptomyces sp. NPDC056160]|uniref:DUF6508 domain-containing protein n=1 Tax=Streptomyces sp. NPDC056160 TaxID=3345731 RepID=UPI0035D5C5D6
MPGPVHYLAVTAPDGEVVGYAWAAAAQIGFIDRVAGSSSAHQAGIEWFSRMQDSRRRGLTPSGVLALYSREPGAGPVFEAPGLETVKELARVVTPADDRRLLDQLVPRGHPAWRELAEAFDALTDEDRDVRWSGGRKRADGVHQAPFPLHSRPLERAVDALSGVGAVTAEHRWTDDRLPEVPAGGRLMNPADAVRAATAVVRGERFGEGRIARAVRNGLLDAVADSLRAWYADPDAAPSPSTPTVCRYCGGSPAVDAAFRAHLGLLLFLRFRRMDGPVCRTCGMGLYRGFTTYTLCWGWWSPLSPVLGPLTLVRNLLAVRQLKRLPDPGPGMLEERFDPGTPIYRRPPAYVALVPLVSVLCLIGAAVYGGG